MICIIFEPMLHLTSRRIPISGMRFYNARVSSLGPTAPFGAVSYYPFWGLSYPIEVTMCEIVSYSTFLSGLAWGMAIGAIIGIVVVKIVDSWRPK